ncbi:MAG TPA: ATP-binding protein [Candidatus Xenobia bacterium]|nr:ATP-binding protein [Candidatus Xenobia bacterium]
MEVLERQVLDSTPCGVLAVDREARILFINRSLAKAFGLDPPEWIGRPAADLTAIIQSRFECPENFALCSGLDPDDRRALSAFLEFRQRNGEQVLHVREDTRPLRSSNGAIRGRIYVYTDMAREKEIDRMKSEFIAIASHELRTPMTSIKGSVDLILSGYAGDISTDTQELLEIAQKNCDRLIRLINDILDLAKIEAGQVRLNLERLDLTEAVQRSIQGVQALADQNEIELVLERPAELPLVEVDKDRIEQVVTNLLSNAIKFSPPRGQVRVALEVVDGWVQCCVQDQGSGIAEDQLQRVFGKFQQLGNSARKGGTGLGLAISQALINEHRGRIWVESKLNQGTKFVFRLPACADIPSPS